jgi:hypothetical protein
MFNTIITAFIPLIIKLIVTIIGIIILTLVPKIIAFIKTKLGATKFAQALIVADKVVAQIEAYIAANPAASKVLDDLYAQFKAGILQVLPLNDAEIDFLFKTILADLIAALGLNPTDYVTAFAPTPAVKAKLLFK